MIEKELNVKQFISASMDLCAHIQHILEKTPASLEEKHFFYFEMRCPFYSFNAKQEINKHKDVLSQCVISKKHRLFMCKDCSVVLNFDDLLNLMYYFKSDSKVYAIGVYDKISSHSYNFLDEVSEENSINVKFNNIFNEI